MNTDEQRATQPQPKKSHHEDTKKSFAILRVFVSSW